MNADQLTPIIRQLLADLGGMEPAQVVADFLVELSAQRPDVLNPSRLTVAVVEQIAQTLVNG